MLRGDRRFTTALSNLFESPRYDTTLVAGDKVIIEEDERFFLAMGATGVANQGQGNESSQVCKPTTGSSPTDWLQTTSFGNST